MLLIGLMHVFRLTSTYIYIYTITVCTLCNQMRHHTAFQFTLLLSLTVATKIKHRKTLQFALFLSLPVIPPSDHTTFQFTGLHSLRVTTTPPTELPRPVRGNVLRHLHTYIDSQEKNSKYHFNSFIHSFCWFKEKVKFSIDPSIQPSVRLSIRTSVRV